MIGPLLITRDGTTRRENGREDKKVKRQLENAMKAHAVTTVIVAALFAVSSSAVASDWGKYKYFDRVSCSGVIGIVYTLELGDGTSLIYTDRKLGRADILGNCLNQCNARGWDPNTTTMYIIREKVTSRVVVPESGSKFRIPNPPCEQTAENDCEVDCEAETGGGLACQEATLSFKARCGWR